jgi:hypothetical protein
MNSDRPSDENVNGRILKPEDYPQDPDRILNDVKRLEEHSGCRGSCLGMSLSMVVIVIVVAWIVLRLLH